MATLEQRLSDLDPTPVDAGTPSATSPTSSTRERGEDVAARLLDSSAQLSFDPDAEIDWDAPLDPHHYGITPQWSSLYGTPMWDEMTQAQRVTLTRHEAGSIMSIGIWFEMILQQMLLREQYNAHPADSEFRFALTEIADECRHSLMFAKAIAKMGVPRNELSPATLRLGRLFKTLGRGETAYGAILVAEEILDVMQRDWMRSEDVLDIIRTTSRIHVVEESRHMTFARQEIRTHLDSVSPRERRFSALVIAIVAHVIVSNMISPSVYAAAGLDADRAVAQAKASPHRRVMMRTSCAHLMRFMSEAGLLTPPAVRIYRRLHML